MKKSVLHLSAISVCLFAAVSAFAGVTVTSPANNSTVGTSVKFVATATASSCSKGVASMGIYPQPNELSYVANGASLNATLNLNPGTYNAVVQEWDNCGGSTTSTVKITVTSGGTTGVYVTSPATRVPSALPQNSRPPRRPVVLWGVASMGIYTAPSKLAYVVNGASLNTNLSLSPGTYNTTVEECAVQVAVDSRTESRTST